MNRDKALRKAYYDALNGTITYNTKVIPVTDVLLKTGDKDNLFILLGEMYGDDTGNNATNSWLVTFSISIYHKQGSSATRDVVDDIDELIENIIIPNTKTNGLIQQTGWVIHQPRLLKYDYVTLVNDTKTQTIIHKSLTFSQRIEKSRS